MSYPLSFPGFFFAYFQYRTFSKQTNQPKLRDPSFCFIHLQQVSHESSQIRWEETRQVQQRHQQPRCRSIHLSIRNPVGGDFQVFSPISSAAPKETVENGVKRMPFFLGEGKGIGSGWKVWIFFKSGVVFVQWIHCFFSFFLLAFWQEKSSTNTISGWDWI